MKKISRRSFNQSLIKGVGVATIATTIPASCAAESATSDGKKLGVALVGLGSYSTYQLGPALLETKHCYLAGIVTGTPDKEKIWAKKYNLPKTSIYNYENFDSIVKNDSIDIVCLLYTSPSPRD